MCTRTFTCIRERAYASYKHTSAIDARGGPNEAQLDRAADEGAPVPQSPSGHEGVVVRGRVVVYAVAVDVVPAQGTGGECAKSARGYVWDVWAARIKRPR